MAAHYGPVQKEDRYIQAVSALKDGVRVDIDDIDRGKRHAGGQLLELRHHLIAQVALVAMHDSQSGGQ